MSMQAEHYIQQRTMSGTETRPFLNNEGSDEIRLSNQSDVLPIVRRQQTMDDA